MHAMSRYCLKALGLYNFERGFRWAYKRGVIYRAPTASISLYAVAKTGIKGSVSKRAKTKDVFHLLVVLNRIQNSGGLMIEYIFLFTGRWACN